VWAGVDQVSPKEEAVSTAPSLLKKIVNPSPPPILGAPVVDPVSIKVVADKAATHVAETPAELVTALCQTRVPSYAKRQTKTCAES
jgi:hypothetical protein